MLRASRLSFCTIFALSELFTSLVVERRLLEDDLIVLTRIADEAIKDWVVSASRSLRATSSTAVGQPSTPSKAH